MKGEVQRNNKIFIDSARDALNNEIERGRGLKVDAMSWCFAHDLMRICFVLCLLWTRMDSAGVVDRLFVKVHNSAPAAIVIIIVVIVVRRRRRMGRVVGHEAAGRRLLPTSG